MERVRYRYYRKAALKAEAEKEESLRKEKQYWVRFKQITINDVNAILGIYQRLTGYSPSPLKEEDFNRLRKQFTGDFGFGEYPIQKGSNLEARRRIDSDGELFVRFKISPGQMGNRYKRDGADITMQEEIDRYFLSKNMAVLLKATF